MLEHFLYCCSPDSVSYWCSYFNYRKSRVCAFASLGAIAAAGSRCCVRLGAFVQGAAAVCAWECWRRCCWCCRKGYFPICWSLCWRNSLDSVSYWVSYSKYRKSCLSLGAGAAAGRRSCVRLGPLLCAGAVAAAAGKVFLLSGVYAGVILLYRFFDCK